MQYIKIHSQDNVAVALADMAAGSQSPLMMMQYLKPGRGTWS
jgi:hypothetical protein